MDLNSQVQKEGLSIIRLCKGLSDVIRFGRLRKTFLYETDGFIEFIEKVLKEIEVSARDAASNSLDPPIAKTRLKDFNLIRSVLSWLYVFTKEAIDADTLSIPYSLTIFLNYISRKLSGGGNVSLVVLGSSDLMYYKYNLIDLRNLTNTLNYKISNCPKLTKETGILKFPYCAVQDILTNCILFHEMGHYFYEKRNLQGEIQSDVSSSLRVFIESNSLDDSNSLLPVRLQNYSRQLLSRWSDEIYADVFAIRILGPAFHLAFVELEQILHTTESADINKRFSVTHPADDYRFKMHAKWLFKEEWEEVIKDRVPWVFEQLKKCQKLELENDDFYISCKPPLKDNELNPDIFHQWMFNEFKKITIKIESDISTLLNCYDRPIDDFNFCDERVTSCLRHGVVPSTIYNEQGQGYHPSPTTILNSGFFFYLQGMDGLLSIVNNSESDIDNKVNFGKRLNEWLAKAIEDWQIIQERNKS